MDLSCGTTAAPANAALIDRLRDEALFAVADRLGDGSAAERENGRVVQLPELEGASIVETPPRSEISDGRGSADRAIVAERNAAANNTLQSAFEDGAAAAALGAPPLRSAAASEETVLTMESTRLS